MKISFVAAALMGTALAGFAASARADIFHVTFEAPGVQNANTAGLCAALGSGTCVVGTETFDSRASGSTFTTDYGTGGVISGTYTSVQINGADQYGGAGGTGSYPVAFGGTPYNVDLTTTLVSGINYFGFWLSALDDGNQVSFYRNGVDVFDFTPADLIAALGACPGSAYCGNPNSPYHVNGSQLYVFVNFFDTDGTFDSIHFREDPAVGGYELDNHTVGYVTAETGTAVPEPASLALFGAGLLGLLGARRRKAA